MRRDFFEILESCERRLQLFLALCFVCLIVVQLIYTQDPYRFYLSFAERLEGIAWQDHEFAAAGQRSGEQGRIKITSEDPVIPGVTVLANGRPVAEFTQRELWLQVTDGDEILIDGSSIAGSLTFTVTGVSPGVSWPTPRYQVTTNAGSVSLGRVRVE